MKRNHMIDILKGICIICVIITHFEWKDTDRLLPIFPFFIDMAVPVFMIISGYVYAISYERHDISSIGRAYHIDYVIDKLLRYTIPFIIIYVLELIAFYRIDVIYNKRDIIWNFFTGGFGYGSYYYPVMIQFIFVFPIVFFLVKKFDFFGLILSGFLNALYEVLQRLYYVSGAQYRLLLFRYLLLIAFGCYLYLKKGKIRKPIGIVSALIGILFIWIYKYRDYTPHVVIYWTGTSFLAALYIMPVIGLLLRSAKINAIKCPPIELLGKASYHIFLSQMFFYQFVMYPLQVRFAEAPAISLLFISIVACISSGILFYWVETRITKWIMKGVHAMDIKHICQCIINYVNKHAVR